MTRATFLGAQLHPAVAGMIWIGLGVVILAFAALFFLEGVLYLTGNAPITAYIRNWTWGHVFPAVLVGALLLVAASMAVTHFILDGQSPAP